MKGGRWVQMSGKKRGRMEVGGMESDEILWEDITYLR